VARGWSVEAARDALAAQLTAIRATGGRDLPGAELPGSRVLDDTAPGAGLPDAGLPDAIVAAVIAARDLAAATGRPAEQVVDRAALRLAVRVLADRFAARHPGRSLELRVPPYAAVQALAGPRPTRGTPPNVVEADPLTWVELATGRLGWAEATATGRVRASGARSDLSALLPL